MDGWARKYTDGQSEKTDISVERQTYGHTDGLADRKADKVSRLYIITVFTAQKKYLVQMLQELKARH
jgi:hypothetical protein